MRLAKIANRDARRLLDRWHPLGAGAAFRFALGAFWNGRCQGVLTFGQPGMNTATRALGIAHREALELRKFYLTDALPRNSESRCLAVAARLIRAAYPELRALITYCDADQAAVAYRAAGWVVWGTSSYVARYLVAGKWYTFRDAHRYGLAKAATETERASQTKLVLWLRPPDAPVV